MYLNTLKQCTYTFKCVFIQQFIIFNPKLFFPQVHKEFYCNTRHVHKSVTSSSPTSQAPTAPTHQPHRSSPGSSPPAAAAPAAKSGYNMVLNHQPLYAAISTSPLILVPCSYVAGGEGLSPAGLVPAGNIVIPNPQQQAATAAPADPHVGSVIPTFTVVAAEQEVVEPAKQEAAKAVKEVVTRAVAPKQEVAAAPKSPTGIVCKEEATTEQPLDLSFRKRDAEGKKNLQDSGRSLDVGCFQSLFDIYSVPEILANHIASLLVEYGFGFS